MYRILVTGGAGFIGIHTAKKLISKKNIKIIGIDNLNNYYSTKLKRDRLNILKRNNKNNFIFKKLNICDQKRINKLFKTRFNQVLKLAFE